MRLRNLTPLDAQEYGALDVHGDEHHVVAIKACYRLTRGSDERSTHRTQLASGDDAGRLLRRDVFEGGEVNTSSVRAESDLAPCKPRCDVLVRATAWAPRGEPTERWQARLRVAGLSDAPLVDKRIEVCGPRWFERTLAGWSLTRPEQAPSVPVRWEHTFGGNSVVPHPGQAHGQVGGQPPLLDEVCFTNPLGAGWMEARHLDALAEAGQRAPDRLPAPQIEQPGAPVTHLVVAEHPPRPVDPREMAEIAAGYGALPVGLGHVGRAWTPRIQKAGTFDDAWLRDRHPFLPDDFSFAYWNAAPVDQQIAHPDPGLRVDLWNLAAPDQTMDGRLSFELPPHRAFVMAFVAGLPLPVPAALDTILIDAEELTVACVWRTLVARQLGVRVLEARFEVDPSAPLLKMEVRHG
jgi:hypothetical protein